MQYENERQGSLKEYKKLIVNILPHVNEFSETLEDALNFIT